MSTYLTALYTVAQSLACHPSWSLDNHLANLEQEGLNLDEAVTTSSWPNKGPSTHPLRAYVASWVKSPGRCKERALYIRTATHTA